MNIFSSEEPDLVIAKTCGRTGKETQKVTYAFSESFHSLCLDKKEMMQAEIEACERLLKYATNEPERAVIEKEITELRMALDFLT
jgi:hypothetical protein